MPSMTNDRDLIERICRGDETAYELLHDRYAGPLRRHLERMVHDPAPAADLLQETLLRVWTRADQWSGRGALKAWLFRIATNLALNFLDERRRHRRIPLEKPVEADEDDQPQTPEWMIDRAALGADTLLENSERRHLLQEAVAALPQEKREVFDMVYVAGMDIHQVAEVLEIPNGTVKSRLFYARRKVADQWRLIAREWEEE
ncbi:MAG: sigma-70 family RNA polymerase sigma factor [Candidatus Latescibacteria bacterium]|nr:sigma-70 family RNA polymerase sigma factor [Candidatus Latescibacterota bacterium]